MVVSLGSCDKNASISMRVSSHTEQRQAKEGPTVGVVGSVND